MALVNRDKDTSEKRIYVNWSGPTSTGISYPLFIVPNNCKIVSAMGTNLGLSGAPVHTLFLNRFIVGTGFTSIALGTSVLAPAHGTSGSATFAVTAAGVTNPLQAGDVISLLTGVANTGTVQTTISFAVEVLQDIATAYGA